MNPKYFITTLISSVLCFSCTQDSASDKEQNDIMPAPVVNKAPVADFSYTISDYDVSFKNHSADEDGDTLAYEWSIGNSITSEQLEPVQTLSAGEYEITLHVTDGKLTRSITKSITIAEVIVEPTLNLIEADDENEAYIARLIDLEVAIPQANEDECRRYFAANQHKFQSSPIVEVNHILIASDFFILHLHFPLNLKR